MFTVAPTAYMSVTRWATYLGSLLDSTVRDVPTEVENEHDAPAATHFEHGFSLPH